MAPQSASPIEVFYSYSHIDEKLRDQLQNHLTMLKREGVINGWHDRRIIAGEEWDGKINEHLNSADVILLLVSSDFLASKYCYDIEVTQAMERHDAGDTCVIPIILRPCDWQTAPFGKVQGLPKDAKPVTRWDDKDEAFLDIARGIRRAAEDIRAKRNIKTASSAEETKPAPHTHIPNYLIVDFVTRKDREGHDIIERLKRELAPHEKRLIVLWGAGGVGKTAIAAEAARSLTGEFKQRVVWVSADGLEKFALSTLLDGIARQLGRDDLLSLAIEPKKEAVRDIVAATPTLIVLDNFETIALGEGHLCAEWLAQPALCSALITTRQKIEIARNIPVEHMSPEEANDLLQRLIAQAHDQKAFINLDRARVIQTAEANPLVLQWVVGQIDLAQDPQEVLDDLAHGEGSAAQRVFDRSYNLQQMTRGGRAVLLALSLFVPSATRPMVAEVAGITDKKRFREALKILSSLWLVHTTDEGRRLAVEGLTRELAKARLSTDTRGKTFRPRFVSRFLKYAETHERVTPADLNAMEEEKDNVLGAMDIAYELNGWRSVIRIGNALIRFLDTRGYWDEALQRNEQTSVSGQAINDQFIVAICEVRKAIILQQRGEYDKASQLYQRILIVFRKTKNDENTAVVLGNLGGIFINQGEYAEAHRLYNESFEIEKKLGNQQGMAASLHNLGVIAREQGNYAEAHRLYNESFEIEKKLGNQQGIAGSLYALGILAEVQGNHADARRFIDESLALNTKLGNQVGIASALHQLGRLSIAEEKIGESSDYFNQSLTIFKKLGDKISIAECLESIGVLRLAHKKYLETGQLFDESLEIAEALSAKPRIGSVKYSRGLLAEKQNDKAEAMRLFREALNIFEELGSPKAENARRDLRRLEAEMS